MLLITYADINSDDFSHEMFIIFGYKNIYFCGLTFYWISTIPQALHPQFLISDKMFYQVDGNLENNIGSFRSVILTGHCLMAEGIY